MSDSGQQQYCLRWNNHSSNFVTVFEELFRTEAFTDVTLSAYDGFALRCHKMVLAACSTYFQDLFIKSTTCENPVVILNDVNHVEIKAILDYMYRGEVNVAQDQLASLLSTARCLRIKGLVDDTEPPEQNHKMEEEEILTPPPSNSTSTSSAAHSSGYLTPPPVPNATFIPYGNIPVEQNHNHLASWSAFSGQPPLQQDNVQGPKSQGISTHNSRSASRRKLSGSYDRSSESSPLSKKKYSSIVHQSRDSQILRNVLHHGQQDLHIPDNVHEKSNGSLHDRRNSAEHIEIPVDEEEKHVPLANYSASTTRSGNPKPEWKRYKQYTREHIQDAMNAVRTKQMSALQAARKYGVPSRTLYDKLKKAGILPSRAAGGVQRRDSGSHGGSARFPYTSPTLNGSIYGTSLGAAVVSESESETNGLGPLSIGDTNGLGPLSIGETAYGIVRTFQQQRDSVSLTSPPVSINSVAAAAAAAAVAAAAAAVAEDTVMDMSKTRTPSPAHHHPAIVFKRSTHSPIHAEDEDQVEDLSMSRTSGGSDGQPLDASRSSASPVTAAHTLPLATVPLPLRAISPVVKQERNEDSNDGSTRT